MKESITQIFLANAEDTERFGAELYKILPEKCVVFLHGDLGAGKTTLVRGYLRVVGHKGTVKSPTYNLVEEYLVNDERIYHFDLYRINNPEELEWIGIDDYFTKPSVCFIEWPDKGVGFLPPPDFVITFMIQGNGRMLEIKRTSNK